MGWIFYLSTRGGVRSSEEFTQSFFNSCIQVTGNARRCRRTSLQTQESEEGACRAPMPGTEKAATTDRSCRTLELSCIIQ